ncbi:PASTA domain-containing protein [Baekduia sp. Peel2402]|uniref:PASTA domain-containing protein n=1 Tax=Baekduia sp. Peel2402 TaxID=3458296 RepID=UPI00403EEED4
MSVRVLVCSAAGLVALAAGTAVATADGSDGRAARPPVAHAAAKARVPNEVGRNHQKAQDDLQAHGFYNLREKDCSGRDRSLIWDRNWKVVKQTPAAGKRVSKNRVITLCSVKYTD